MKLRELYSKEYIEDLYGLRPRSEAIMRSRLNSIQRYRSCRVSKVSRYSQVKFHSQTVSSRHNSAASSFDRDFRGLPNQRSRSGGSISEQNFNAFRNYYVPITPDLQIHLSQCTLPDSQPTNSALLMLDGSSSSNRILPALPEHGLPRQNCSFCRQPTNKFRELTHQLSCGHVCHDNCLSENFRWPSFSYCPTCNAVSVLDSKSGIDPSRHPESHIAFICHRSLIYSQGNSCMLQRVNTTMIWSLNALFLQTFQSHRPQMSLKGRF
jgi:hypothetical protein